MTDDLHAAIETWVRRGDRPSKRELDELVVSLVGGVDFDEAYHLCIALDRGEEAIPTRTTIDDLPGFLRRITAEAMGDGLSSMVQRWNDLGVFRPGALDTLGRGPRPARPTSN
jgi:hypothetical protein